MTVLVYIIGCWFYLKSELISELFSSKLSKRSIHNCSYAVGFGKKRWNFENVGKIE
jgi:hypothetical protein